MLSDLLISVLGPLSAVGVFKHIHERHWLGKGSLTESLVSLLTSIDKSTIDFFETFFVNFQCSNVSRGPFFLIFVSVNGKREDRIT